MFYGERCARFDDCTTPKVNFNADLLLLEKYLGACSFHAGPETLGPSRTNLTRLFPKACFSGPTVNRGVEEAPTDVRATAISEKELVELTSALMSSFDAPSRMVVLTHFSLELGVHFRSEGIKQAFGRLVAACRVHCGLPATTDDGGAAQQEAAAAPPSDRPRRGRRPPSSG